MAAYREKDDLIAIGAYQPGTDALTDAAIAAREPIDGFLRQPVEDRSTAEEADAALTQLALLFGRARCPMAAPTWPTPAAAGSGAGHAAARGDPAAAPRRLGAASTGGASGRGSCADRTSTAAGWGAREPPAPATLST